MKPRRSSTAPALPPAILRFDRHSTSPCWAMPGRRACAALLRGARARQTHRAERRCGRDQQSDLRPGWRSPPTNVAARAGRVPSLTLRVGRPLAAPCRRSSQRVRTAGRPIQGQGLCRALPRLRSTSQGRQAEKDKEAPGRRGAFFWAEAVAKLALQADGTTRPSTRWPRLYKQKRRAILEDAQPIRRATTSLLPPGAAHCFRRARPAAPPLKKRE